MFSWLWKRITRSATRRKQQEEWSRFYANEAANTDTRLPLDPEQDPWRT